jgi:hypothetical protein
MKKLRGKQVNKSTFARYIELDHEWIDNNTQHSRKLFKGTVARDFWPLVFFMNPPHMGP